MTPDTREKKVLHQSYIKPGIISQLRKDKTMWTDRDKKFHDADPTCYPSKSVIIYRACCMAAGWEWKHEVGKAQSKVNK